jgi:hypothetical protein
MPSKLHQSKIRWAVLAAALTMCASLPADEPDDGSAKRSLAGQMCPSGSFVIGFDAAGDIVCSERCMSDCQAGAAGADTAPAATAATAATAAVAGTPTAATAAAAGAAEPDTGPVISEIQPDSVLYGTRELRLTILGAGFNADSLVEFAGTTYTPTVNQEGTRLEVTLATRKLTIGRYAVTVANGPELKSTLGKALVVY